MTWRYNYILKPTFILVDLWLIAVAHYTAVFIRFNSISQAKGLLTVALVFAFTWVLLNPVLKLNHESRFDRRSWRYGVFMLGQAVSVLALGFYLIFSNMDDVPRLYLGYFIVIQFILLFYFRFLRRDFIKNIRRKGYNSKLLYIIGSDNEKVLLNKWLGNNPWSGYRLETGNYFNVTSRARVEDYTSWIRGKFNITSGEELVIGKLQDSDTTKEIVNFAEDLGVRVSLIEPLDCSRYGNPSLRKVGPFTVIPVRDEPLLRLSAKIIKRITDLIVSGLFIIVGFWWLYIIIGVLIKLTSKGPVIFKQKRIGRNRQMFWCYKFRSMAHNEVSERGNGEITAQGDMRITKIGSLLRKYNLDELPQFLNVFGGSMSIVGPRPHMISEDFFVEKKLSRYRLRQRVKPGVTGLAAIKGLRGGTDDMALMQKRVDEDIYYIENWSLGLDFKIIFQTTIQMFKKQNNGH